eukprot:CAMPEP_0198290648 /NCGR_PEP_ID=MMETSP1449-20131203/8434_1 /TAXON_ID=420275 /ORGANISM="Attheya septentrionalis, Strain CCMP2084" /LENGTH=355 /DNA_ID=CAMNT_0043989175 /DNA_START=183 /DNA_END=1250 /DNA_ORIENTATION=+
MTTTESILPSLKRQRLRGSKASKQPSTIQEQLERALVRLTDQTVTQLRMRSAGRTDKGVHATGQVVAFDYYPPPPISELVAADPLVLDPKANPKNARLLHSLFASSLEQDDEWKLRRAINSHLPADICVRSVAVLTRSDLASRPFEPRRFVRLKRYTYRIRFHQTTMNTPTTTCSSTSKQLQQHDQQSICQSGPHTLRRAHDEHSCLWICPWALDKNLLPTVCKELQGQHNFGCFIHAKDRHRPGGDNIMTLNTCRFQLSGPTTEMDSDSEPDNDSDDGTSEIVNCKFTFEAKGFRRSMVRNLVGFLVDVCRGLRNMDDFTAIWTGTDEAAKLVCASPASGLCLAKVHYEPSHDT